MRRRTAKPLSHSEYVSSDPENSDQVWGARLLLMETVGRVYREMLVKLRSEVLPAYKEMRSSGFDFDQILWNSSSPYKQLPSNSPLMSTLEKWAKKFHVAPGWLLDEAIRTLRSWDIAPDCQQRLEWHAMHSFSNEGATGPSFEFSFPGWETEAFTWKRYSESLRKEFQIRLIEYETRTRKLAESRGLLLARRKYSLANFEWYVLYEFAGWSSTKIAAERGGAHARLSESAVLKGVKTVRDLVSIPRFSSKQA
jgi:hypothetical protein